MKSEFVRHATLAKQKKRRAPGQQQHCAAAAFGADAAAAFSFQHPAAQPLNYLCEVRVETTCKSWRERFTSSMASATASSCAWQRVSSLASVKWSNRVADIWDWTSSHLCAHLQSFENKIMDLEGLSDERD